MNREVERAARAAAEASRIEPEAFLALVAVESAGEPWWTVNGERRPVIRFEGHKFHERVNGTKRERAVREGLASPVRGAIRNPSSGAARYALFERAAEIDRTAAIEATSWGLGQIMGFNWRMLGLRSAEALKARAEDGVQGQVDLMIRYVTATNLHHALKAHDWRAVARAWNGPAYAEHGYHKKLAGAYRRIKRGEVALDARWVQESLERLGYRPGEVDGVLGPFTKSAVRSFQADRGLVPDGIPGPLTAEAIEAELAKLDAAGRRKKAVASAAGGAALASQAPEIIDQASDVAGQVSGLRWSLDSLGLPEWLVIGVVVVAVGFLVWRLTRGGEEEAA